MIDSDDQDGYLSYTVDFAGLISWQRIIERRNVIANHQTMGTHHTQRRQDSSPSLKASLPQSGRVWYRCLDQQAAGGAMNTPQLQNASALATDNDALATIPVAPHSLPLLGHVIPLIRDPLGFLTSLPDHGRLVEVRLGRSRAIVICDAALTRHVLANDNVFDKGGFVFDRAREVLGEGLATCAHRKHREQRRQAQSAFHRNRLPGYARLMTPEIVAMTKSWEDGAVIDLTKEMTAIAGRLSIVTMFVDVLTPAEINGLQDDVAILLTGFYKRALMPPPMDRLPLFGNRRYDRARERLRNTIRGIIAERSLSTEDHGDLLSMLLAQANTNGKALSHGELVDRVLTLFLASFETTASSLISALYLLARHPDVQEKLHQEVTSVLAGQSVDPKHVPGLRWTSHVIAETLRFYPPGWLITRTVAWDTVLDGYRLPAGTAVVFSPYIIHHRSDLYGHPEEFRPDRWSHEPKVPRDQFIPFGYGARSCLGSVFAQLELTLTLASIASEWRLHPTTSRTMKPVRSAVLRPRVARIRITAYQP